MELSELEQSLYDFIKFNKMVSIDQIKKELSPKHVGALGKIMDKIKKVKNEKEMIVMLNL